MFMEKIQRQPAVDQHAAEERAGTLAIANMPPM